MGLAQISLIQEQKLPLKSDSVKILVDLFSELH